MTEERPCLKIEKGKKPRHDRWEAQRILSWNFYRHPVVLEALTGVEVEDKQHMCPVKHYDLVLFMLGTDKGLEGGEKKMITHEFFMNSHYLSHLGIREL